MSNFVIPAVLRESTNGISRVTIDDILLEKREVYLTCEINDTSATEFLKVLNFLEHDCGGSEITIYINSPGGSVNAGLAIYDYMRAMKSPITTVCIGNACSMGAIIFLAGDRRLVMPHSEIMIHDASFGSANFSGLKPGEIQVKADSLLDTSKLLRAIVAERTGQSLKKVTAAMKDDSFYKSEDAVKFGLATEIITEV